MLGSDRFNSTLRPRGLDVHRRGVVAILGVRVFGWTQPKTSNNGSRKWLLTVQAADSDWHHCPTPSSFVTVGRAWLGA